MPSKQSQSLQILVVDDEPELRELIGEYLSARGHIVHVASDGHDALTCLSEEPIEVVLTDLCMPSMEGIEIVRAIRERNNPLGVVVMTGFPTIESVTTAMKLGASDYVLKPFRLLEVHDALLKAARQGTKDGMLHRCQCSNRFYEAANALLSLEQLPALLRLLMEAAQGEVQCEAVCVWLREAGGTWKVWGRSGEHPEFLQVQPADVQALRQEGGLILSPISTKTRRYAVIALAGHTAPSSNSLGRLRHLTRAIDLAIGRVTL
jgi:CheY-like chemotaxis protein